jgi:hypothetical protein
MTTDSTPDATGPGTEATPTSPGDVPLQIRMQILSTEHWSLLATRALAWNETFTRANMFMSALSFSVVALALVGQASGFGSDFRTFALIVLPVVLFLGIATALRMDSSNYNDLLCIVGMNRIRAAYVEVDPDMKRYFIMGYTDDYEGIIKTMGGIPTRSVAADILSASPVVVGVLNAVLVASIAGVASIQAGLSEGWAMFAAGTAFVVTVGVLALLTAKTLNDVQKDYKPVFPGDAHAQAVSGTTSTE